jgi:hypothetical protein
MSPWSAARRAPRGKRRRGKRLFGRMVGWHCVYVSGLLIVCVLSVFQYQMGRVPVEGSGCIAKGQWLDPQCRDCTSSDTRRLGSTKRALAGIRGHVRTTVPESGGWRRSSMAGVQDVSSGSKTMAARAASDGGEPFLKANVHI